MQYPIATRSCQKKNTVSMDVKDRKPLHPRAGLAGPPPHERRGHVLRALLTAASGRGGAARAVRMSAASTHSTGTTRNGSPSGCSS